jgi:hypothetical protein
MEFRVSVPIMYPALLLQRMDSTGKERTDAVTTDV